MRCEFFVALQCKVLHQFVERFASESARRVEDPGAFRAAPTRKTRLVNPYQLPTHGGPRRTPKRCMIPCLVLASDHPVLRRAVQGG